MIVLPLVSAAAAAPKIVGGVIVGLVGVALLVFNGRVSQAIIKGQREGVGSLFGSRRAVSDRFHDSRLLAIYGRAFLLLAGVVFVIAGFGSAIKA